MKAPLIELGDCEWFAVDSIGQIGFFTSAGSQMVPEYYWTRTDWLLELAEQMRSMPVVCEHRFVADKQPGGRYESWIDAAERGVFGYDYDLYTGSGYKLVTVPDRPSVIGEKNSEWARGIPVFTGEFGGKEPIIASADVIEWKPR